MAGWWFPPSTTVSSTYQTDHHDIAEILLKVALNTISLNHQNIMLSQPQTGNVGNLNIKKSLKKPKRQSNSVNRRTNNTMANIRIKQNKQYNGKHKDKTKQTMIYETIHKK